MGGGKIGKKHKKIGHGKIEMTVNFSVIVNLYLWKLFKNNDDEVCKTDSCIIYQKLKRSL
jgi:hypothetical protein